MIPHHHHDDIQSAKHHHDHHNSDKDDSPFEAYLSHHSPDFGKDAVITSDVSSKEIKQYSGLDFDLPTTPANIYTLRARPPNIDHFSSHLFSIALSSKVSRESLPAPPPVVA